MTIDLRDVIGVPGHSIAFDYSPDLSELLTNSVTEIVGEPRVSGEVRNSAGLLTLRADVTAEVKCVCDRCLREFTREITGEITASLSEAESARDDPEYYFVEGTTLDPGEIIVTELILDAEQSTLCKEDCRGLCVSCGADLNEGDCACKPDIDPRLAALANLLE
ncbi:MAG: DUF177 domain-containing protein [Oscillospiraceae bacterium]|jgi:uncharacterized protein|nr:DUF177 domain-containing protein [Oscillospiraceae bacterium]